MRFQIKAYYTESDSLNTDHVSEVIDYGWKNDEIASENAKAIIEHYKAYRQEHSAYKYSDDEIEFETKWWYHNPTNAVAGYPKIDHSMYLKLDGGSFALFICPWCSYFNSLESVEVQIKEMKYYVD